MNNMVEDLEGVDLAFSSSAKGKSPSLSIENVRGEVAAYRLKEREKLALEAIDLSEEAEYLQVIEAARSSIVTKYKRAGVSLSDRDFPKLFLISQEKRGQLDRRLESKEGFYDGEMFCSVVFVERNGGLIDLCNIHHELEHGVGRTALVLSGRERAEGGGMRVRTRQVGHWTESVDHDGSSVERGRVLEEGLVTYNAIQFVLESEDVVVKKARESFVKSKIRENLKSLKFRKALEDTLAHGTTCQNGLGERLGDNYRAAVNTVILLRDGVEKSEGVSGVSVVDNLLDARVNTGKRRKVMERIDTALGKGTTRRIFQTPFEFGEINRLNDSLKESTNQVQR